MRAVELDAAVHGAGVHHDGVGLGARETRRVDAEEARVLAHARQERPRKPLALDAQHHHHVGAFERGLDAIERLDRVRVVDRRQERARPGEAHLARPGS